MEGLRHIASIAENAHSRTFKQCAEAVHKSKSVEYKSAKHSDQWINTLQTYVFPVFGNLPVESITLGHVVRALEPIWVEKTETATRVRQRIESVLSYAITHGYRSGSNVAAWKGNLDSVLPKPRLVGVVWKANQPALSCSNVEKVWDKTTEGQSRWTIPSRLQT